MLNDTYNTRISDDFQTFEFESVGPKGTILKKIVYSETDVEGVYNLGFGDKNAETDEIDDLVITNNQDTKKVLATVAFTLFSFFRKYPYAAVTAKGSTKARTRLYQMGITNNLEIIEQSLVVLGYTGTDLEPFRKNVAYDLFLAYRKV